MSIHNFNWTESKILYKFKHHNYLIYKPLQQLFVTVALIAVTAFLYCYILPIGVSLHMLIYFLPIFLWFSLKRLFFKKTCKCSPLTFWLIDREVSETAHFLDPYLYLSCEGVTHIFSFLPLLQNLLKGQVTIQQLGKNTASTGMELTNVHPSTASNHLTICYPIQFVKFYY